VPSDANQRVTLARLARAHGIRGEVAAKILTDFPQRLIKLREVWLWDGHGQPRKTEVLACRLSTSRGGQALFRFAGVETRAAAEKLRGLEVQVPMARRAPLAAGCYYISDLAGCEVWQSGERLGAVRGVQQGGTPVLEIDTPHGELLVPLAQEICTKIDTAARRIEVKLPEGLRELNRRG